MMCAAPCGEGAMGVVYGISRFVKLILQIWASVLIFGKYFFLSKTMRILERVQPFCASFKY